MHIFMISWDTMKEDSTIYQTFPRVTIPAVSNQNRGKTTAKLHITNNCNNSSNYYYYYYYYYHYNNKLALICKDLLRRSIWMSSAHLRRSCSGSGRCGHGRGVVSHVSRVGMVVLQVMVVVPIGHAMCNTPMPHPSSRRRWSRVGSPVGVLTEILWGRDHH